MMENRPGGKSLAIYGVVAGGIFIAILITAGVVLGIYFLHPDISPVKVAYQPVFTVVIANTLTPILTLPVAITATTTPVPPGQIGIGVYVRVSGTKGEGLRLRKNPGIDNPMLFLGMESEVFQIKDGPKQADNFIWWYLQAPYDKNRSGWAVQDYLAPILSPGN
jgi:hypothetical protein